MLSVPDQYNPKGGDEIRLELSAVGGLIALNGLAIRWNVTHERARQLSRSDGFPKSVPVFGQSSEVWIAAECREFREWAT